MKALHLKGNHLDGLVSILAKERHGRMHHRRKLDVGQATFVTANVRTDGVRGLFGRVTGVLRNHADYNIELLAASGAIEISINLEDPNGLYTLELAYADICRGLWAMVKNPHKPSFDGGRDTSRLRGFYLKSTGVKNVGKTGRTTLALAVQQDHISKLFETHCLEEGFTMEHY